MWFTKEIQDVLKEYDSNEATGLSSQEVKLRLEKYGENKLKGKKEAENLLEKTAAIFSGGSLSDEDKDAFFQSITELYFDAKSKSRKKYGKKKIDETNK